MDLKLASATRSLRSTLSFLEAKKSRIRKTKSRINQNLNFTLLNGLLELEEELGHNKCGVHVYVKLVYEKNK